MKIANLTETEDGWNAESGMDPGYGRHLGTYDTVDAALSDLKNDPDPDTVLVIEDGEVGGYTEKYERSFPSYEKVAK